MFNYFPFLIPKFYAGEVVWWLNWHISTINIALIVTWIAYMQETNLSKCAENDSKPDNWLRNYQLYIQNGILSYKKDAICYYMDEIQYTKISAMWDIRNTGNPKLSKTIGPVSLSTELNVTEGELEWTWEGYI